MRSAAMGPKAFLFEELETLQSLIDLLEAERDTLIAADVDALPATSREKGRLLVRLNQLANERQSAVASVDFKAESGGGRDWVESSYSADCSAIWGELLQATIRAKELNRVNGLMINSHLSTTKGKLNVLSNAAGGMGLYGSDGRSRLVPGLRSLVTG